MPFVTLSAKRVSGSAKRVSGFGFRPGYQVSGFRCQGKGASPGPWHPAPDTWSGTRHLTPDTWSDTRHLTPDTLSPCHLVTLSPCHLGTLSQPHRCLLANRLLTRLLLLAIAPPEDRERDRAEGHAEPERAE